MIKRNDKVIIIAGDYRGKRGVVLNVLRKQHRVQIKHTGSIKKHVKKNIYKEHPQGGIINKPKSIHVSNITTIKNNTSVKE